MKYLLFSTMLVISLLSTAQVGIGTNTLNASAQLDVTSTTKGFLPPRMTLAERNLIATPATGLVLWCIDCNEMQVYNGTAWRNINGAASSSATSLPAVQICNQVWTTINLDVTTYRNGDLIPQVTDLTAWTALTTGAWCYYSNLSSYGDIYGKLYNWYAVNDPRGLAPLGWHIPTDAEWTTLTTCLGGDPVAGGRMKATGTSLWLTPNTASTNSSGLAVLPGGYRNNNGTFLNVANYGFWWSSTEYDTEGAWYRYLYYGDANARRLAHFKTYGFSMRCVRD